MAIQQKLDKTHEDNDYGYNFDDAYFKIANVNIDIERNQMRIEVRGYASRTARDIENTIGIYKKIFRCSLEEVGLSKLKVNKDQTVADAIKALAYKHIAAEHFSNGKNV